MEDPVLKQTFFTLKFGIGTWQAQFRRKIFGPKPWELDLWKAQC